MLSILTRIEYEVAWSSISTGNWVLSTVFGKVLKASKIPATHLNWTAGNSKVPSIKAQH
jgi:hypothetical protein